MASALFHAGLSLLVLLLVRELTAAAIPWTALALPLILLPLVLLTMALSWFLASCGVFLRDTAPTVGLQPSIVPFSVSNMNTDEPECPCLSLTANPDWAELNTCPVGAAPVTLTTRPALFTDVAVAPVYSVALSEPLSATHSGEPGAAFVPGDAARPHALTKSGSVSGALPGWSETRLIWR